MLELDHWHRVLQQILPTDRQRQNLLLKLVSDSLIPQDTHAIALLYRSAVVTLATC